METLSVSQGTRKKGKSGKVHIGFWLEWVCIQYKVNDVKIPSIKVTNGIAKEGDCM